MNDVNKASSSYGIKRLKVMDRFSMHLEKVWCTTFEKVYNRNKYEILN